jgi:hypothetical protein
LEGVNSKAGGEILVKVYGGYAKALEKSGQLQAAIAVYQKAFNYKNLK